MRFTGRIRFDDVREADLDVAVEVENSHVRFFSGDESLGSWCLADVVANRLLANEFEIDLDGEIVVFLADDPINFAYGAVQQMAEGWARFHSMNLVRRKRAVATARRANDPSRIDEVRRAFVAARGELSRVTPPVQEAPKEPEPDVPGIEEQPAKEPQSSGFWSKVEAATAAGQESSVEEATPEPEPEPDPRPSADESAAGQPSVAGRLPRLDALPRKHSRRPVDEPEPPQPAAELPDAEPEPIPPVPEVAPPQLEPEGHVEPEPVEPELEEELAPVSIEEEAVEDTIEEPVVEDEVPVVEDETAVVEDETPVVEDDVPAQEEVAASAEDSEILTELPEEPEESEPELAATAPERQEPSPPGPSGNGTHARRRGGTPAIGAFGDGHHPAETSGLRASMRSVFSRSKAAPHEHVFVESTTAAGITRRVCLECGHVSIGVNN
ncbi:MAG TPA: hypothetical protein VHL52_00015 [Acidimicrobiia bacterium]|nr:hypothetical protein [Acidimicrobiia bacterium]